MARQSAQELQQVSETELLDYLRDNGPVSYRQAHANLSNGAMQQYRRLKQSGVIKSTVGPDGSGGISHIIELAGSEA